MVAAAVGELSASARFQVLAPCKRLAERRIPHALHTNTYKKRADTRIQTQEHIQATIRGHSLADAPARRYELERRFSTSDPRCSDADRFSAARLKKSETGGDGAAVAVVVGRHLAKP